jgi:5-methylcytosine-specific restriction protein A
MEREAYQPVQGPIQLRLIGVNYRRPKVKRALRYWVYERDNYKCVDCGDDRSNELTLDHVIRCIDGGISMASNLVTVCWSCNLKRDRESQRACL